MAKKRSPQKDSPPTRLRYEYSTVGKGSKKRLELKINEDVPLTAQDLETAKIDAARLSTLTPLDYMLAEYEEMAKGALERGGFTANDLVGSLRTFVERRGARRGDAVWYAAEIHDQAGLIRARRSQGATDQALVHALELGSLLSEARIVGEEAVTGRAYGSVRGSQQTSERESEWTKWQEAAEEVWKKHPSWGKPAVANIIQKQFPGETVRTIRHRIKKPTP